MVGNLTRLLRQTFKSSGIILTAGLIISYIINVNYCFPFLIGSIISILNFLISGAVTEKAINSDMNLKGIILMVSFVIRIIMIAVIGLLLLQNQYNVILYVIGYMSNFISLFMAIKYEERK
ncbi:ATP synthase subunit I [Eubacterium multiforme]|uniref:ATP synthase protein I n=1 Tax=Eubacterium multiforme TaxID=83339 RepID=A0ABT9UQA0_9FIRM|nr:ATP synthase subunit I [Eubacterium multiforme]MDQ0148818.1 ATP synthase protein I [Eubacterium multiforme]